MRTHFNNLNWGQDRFAAREPPPNLGLPGRATVRHRAMRVRRKPVTQIVNRSSLRRLDASSAIRRIEQGGGVGVLPSAEVVERGREERRHEQVNR